MFESEDVVRINGRQFVKLSGLLKLVHAKGVKSIKTSILKYPSKDDPMAITTTEIITEDGKVFAEIGDATPQNVTRNIAPHYLRMCASRSLARACRACVGSPLTCLEELGDLEEVSNTNGNNGRRALPKEYYEAHEEQADVPF